MDKTFLTLEWERWLSHIQTFTNFITVIMLSPTKTWSTTSNQSKCFNHRRFSVALQLSLGFLFLLFPSPSFWTRAITHQHLYQQDLNNCPEFFIFQLSSEINPLKVCLELQEQGVEEWGECQRHCSHCEEACCHHHQLATCRLVGDKLVSWCFHFRWTTRRQRGWRWRTELPAVKGAANLNSCSYEMYPLWHLASVTWRVRHSTTLEETMLRLLQGWFLGSTF